MKKKEIFIRKIYCSHKLFSFAKSTEPFLALLCIVIFRFAGEVRARYLDYGHGSGLRGREFELVRASGLCGMHGIWVLRGTCCLTFHQE